MLFISNEISNFECRKEACYARIYYSKYYFYVLNCTPFTHMSWRVTIELQIKQMSSSPVHLAILCHHRWEKFQPDVSLFSWLAAAIASRNNYSTQLVQQWLSRKWVWVGHFVATSMMYYCTHPTTVSRKTN